jgi:Xaa-Pro dipeptidase
MLFNRDRALKYMRDGQIDVLIAASPVNVTYFTGYRCWLAPLMKEYMTSPGASSNLGQSFAVFPREGEPALVTDALFAVNAADLGVSDLVPYGAPGLDRSLPADHRSGRVERFDALLAPERWQASPVDALLDVLARRGLTEGRIGLDLDGLPLAVGYEIASRLPRAVLMDCSNLIRLVRMVKTPEEIALLRRAAEIAEESALESVALARPGCPVRDLVAHFRARIAQNGADVDHFAYSVEGLGIATEPEHAFRDGDSLYIDFGVVYRGYFSDSGLTLAVGELKPALLDRYDALRDALAAGAAAMRPGARASDIRAAMWDLLAPRGITTSNPHGHGLGLEVRDYPILVANNGRRIRDDCVDVSSDLVLEPDMVLNLESCIFVPGTGAVHIEKSFRVTPAGSEPLLFQDRSAPIQPYRA